ncbi:synaptotagmin-7-like [Dendronephthya gigantea]|uniref:synaptotagmin-7-like n=1 Tax=Dendronephthya gigantea TaxID=151771 RepID=UPI00106C5245|nr:synaptotagmin-7-like [Dendronephthya gigantea]
MEIYTVLVFVLAVIFSFVLALTIVLAILLRRRYFYQLKHISETEPFTPQLPRRSVTKQREKRPVSYAKEPLDEGPDNVFEEQGQEQQSTNSSQITFSLFHQPSDDLLVLDVWSVTDTPPDFVRGYIEAQLFPSDFEPGQFRTNVREYAENGVAFNESFGIPNVSSEMLEKVYLKFFLYKTYGVYQPKCVGHTVFALNDIPWNPIGKTQFKQELRHHQMSDSPSTPVITTDDESPCSSPSRKRDKGELYVSLRYQKKSGRINVVVLKAENIERGSVLQSDPYVKIKLLYQGEVIDKKQTKSQRRNSSPCWNEPFVFNVDEEKGLSNYELIFLVRRRDLLSPHSTMGCVRIGAQVGGAGQSHWYAMLAKGNLMRQVARRHRIK